MTDPLAEAQLFDMPPAPAITLRDRYGEPPFTVIDRRTGHYQTRERQWLSLGIKPEKGRPGEMVWDSPANRYHNWYPVYEQARAELGRKPSTEEVESGYAHALRRTNQHGGTSVFSPTLCEIAYRWYSKTGDRVFDPFAGGSVRGVVASTLARWYTGIELRPEQVEDNQSQAHLGTDIQPHWIQGDAANVMSLTEPGYEADFILSCPPYAHLEKYSEDPRDLSTMEYGDFMESYRAIIRDATSLLSEHRFAAWVIGDVRTPKGDGHKLGLVADTIKAFQDAGMRLYNDHVIIQPTGTAAVRAPRIFDASRKVTTTHEYMLIFSKGDARKAARRLEGVSP